MSIASSLIKKCNMMSGNTMTTDFFKQSLAANHSDNTVRVSFPDTDTNSDTSSIEKQTINDKFEPSHTRWGLMIIFLSLAFAAIGINDSATGSNLHNIQDRYSISYKEASFLFLSNAGGYAISSLCTCHVMLLVGVRMTIFFSAIIYSSGAIITAFAPPFPVIVVSLFRGCIFVEVAHC